MLLGAKIPPNKVTRTVDTVNLWGYCRYMETTQQTNGRFARILSRWTRTAGVYTATINGQDFYAEKVEGEWVLTADGDYSSHGEYVTTRPTLKLAKDSARRVAVGQTAY